MHDHLQREVKRVITTKYEVGTQFSAEDIYWEVRKVIGPKFAITDITTVLTALFVDGTVTRHTIGNETRYAIALPLPNHLDDDLKTYCAAC